MKILVTGGTGVIGAGLIPPLLGHGHQVRLLSRNSEDDAKQWRGVEALNGDVAEATSLRGAAAGCEVVIHIAGIASEQPPELTFSKINVGGTRNVLEEARRSNVKRFIFLSSLGADRGSSAYHLSKFAAEQFVERSAQDWIIVRPGNVYGPGDEVISMILKMVRVLPAVPVIDDGDQKFQPIWYEDLGRAVAALVDRQDMSRRIIELAGPDTTCMNDLMHRFAEITDRKPMRIQVPAMFASAAAKIASLAIDVPVDDTRLTMLREENVLDGTQPDLLASIMGGEPTTLDRGLRLLADVLPEQLPEDGVGALEHKRFWADIKGTAMPPATLMSYFREHVTEVMPIEFAAEPGAPTRIEEGATMTGALPLRGNIQVRIEVDEPTRILFGTVEGHPLAGIVEFTTSEVAEATRFAIDTYTRAANILDFVAMKAGGNAAQSSNWVSVVQRMIDASGGTSDGVHHESKKLHDVEAKRVEERVKSIVQSRQRKESSAREQAPKR